jgi:signal transduction histidine kinase
MEADRAIRVLLVDDNAANLLAYEGILEDLEVDRVKAHSGQEALRNAFHGDFAAILMDIHMPDMDGFGVAAQLRRCERSRETPLLFVTAVFPDQAHVSRGYSLGAVDYLIKPVVPEILRAKLSVFIELYRKRRELIRANIELRKARADAEEASSHKSRFLAGMSHELRTPLNAILGFTGTLLMKLSGPLTTDQERQLNIIQSSGTHLLSLINDLLDLAKIESGKVEIRREAVVCQHVLEEVATALRGLAQAKGLEFGIMSPGAELAVHTDARVLRQILLNLTNNAIKFTDNGQITLGLDRRRDHGRLVTEFSVVDTGAGIKPEDQAKLFQEFQQVGATGTRRHEGTGLGLYLSQKLAALLGGHIEFQSESGKGSTFKMVLAEDA